MKRIKLNKYFGEIVIAHGYELDPTEQYEINIMDELKQQKAILDAVRTMGLSCLSDYHKWLTASGFNADMPNPTNSFVSKFYGKKALWSNDLSQGLVVKGDDGDYYIIMECSRLNKGFRYTQIILTLGGCL